MIKAITLFKRKYPLTVREFQDYWLHKHVNVISRLPGIRRYVQNHPLPVNYAHGEPTYDGIAELWGDSTHSFRDMAADAAYANVLADESVFLDGQSKDLMMTSEGVINDGRGPAGGVKLIEFYRRRQDMTAADFQQYWQQHHGLLANGLVLVRRYVQSITRPGGYSNGRTPVYDAMSSMWFDSQNDLQQTMNCNLYADIMIDHTCFIDVRTRLSLICREHVLIG